MSQVSEAVRRFLLSHVPSIPHLELLLLLWRERREFGVEEISRRLYVAPAVALSLALDLRESELLSDADSGFRVRGEDGSLRLLLEDLDVTYARQVRAVAEIVHGSKHSRTG